MRFSVRRFGAHGDLTELDDGCADDVTKGNVQLEDKEMTRGDDEEDVDDDSNGVGDDNV